MSISNHPNIDYICIGGGGVQAYSFRKFDFEIWVEEEGHVPTFLGWFWVRVQNFAHVRPRSKKDLIPKIKM